MRAQNISIALVLCVALYGAHVSAAAAGKSITDVIDYIKKVRLLRAAPRVSWPRRRDGGNATFRHRPAPH